MNENLISLVDVFSRALSKREGQTAIGERERTNIITIIVIFSAQGVRAVKSRFSPRLEEAACPYSSARRKSSEQKRERESVHVRRVTPCVHDYCQERERERNKFILREFMIDALLPQLAKRN